MERYSYLQAMPNSPLTPLTPLSENMKFEFNFGGDGSLDVYINSVREEHRVEQQQKKLMQIANRTFHKKDCDTLQPKRYSDEFLKLRDVFEAHKQCQSDSYSVTTPKKSAVVKITYTGSTPATTRHKKVLSTQNRTPLKLKNNNVRHKLRPEPLDFPKHNTQSQHQSAKPNKNKIFHRTSPVAAKPLCPQVASILQRCGLSTYCGLFEKEEIDLFTFHLLKLQDLHQMGITNQNHCSLLMREIYYADKYI